MIDPTTKKSLDRMEEKLEETDEKIEKTSNASPSTYFPQVKQRKSLENVPWLQILAFIIILYLDYQLYYLKNY